MRLIVVSDVRQTCEDFVSCMKAMGHVCEFYAHGSTMDADWLSSKPDLLVVKEHGTFAASGYIRRLRTAGHDLLVLAMLADDDPSAMVEALTAGADHVAGPQETCREWQARVLALLRYHRPTTADRLTYREVTISPPLLLAEREGERLPLVGKTFSLLEFFVRNPEVVHSRERIAESVWDRNLDVFSNVIDVTVSKLRKHLDRGFDTPYLQTVVGSGYMLRATDPAA